MKVLTIFDDVPEEKIFTPKARRLFPKQKKCKKKSTSNKINFKFNLTKSTENLSEKSLNLDKISLEEINKDFSDWSQSLEEEECFDEINTILSSSTKDCSSDLELNKYKLIKRPNSPKDENVKFLDENII